MFGRDRQRWNFAGLQRLESPYPDFVEIPLRTPGDAACEALFEGRGARRVIAAEAERHHTDALGVELVAPGEIVVDRCRVAFGLRNQRQIAKAHALAVARSVHYQAADAARG